MRTKSKLPIKKKFTERANVKTPSSLDRWQSIAAIISAIAIPFVLAIVGYFIQKQLADAGLKKDYVLIATNILKENPANQEPELRKWAVTMLDDNSPIPFSGKVKEGLEKGVYIPVSVAPPKLPEAPKPCMETPRPARVMPVIKKFSRPYNSSEELIENMNKFMDISLKGEGESMEDRLRLECLQQYIVSIHKFNDAIIDIYTAKPK
jgi:hypothetical protein